MKTKDELIDDLLNLAFAEDVGDGDHTTLSTIPAEARGKSRLLIKEEGILSGVDIARQVLAKIDPELKMEVFINDGTRVKPGDVAFTVEGSVRSLLVAERTMLNIMQRMSGVATMTDKYQQRLEGLHTRVLDTRKTTPGMRMLEKEAVKTGGGVNHRIGLFDMILIKDNHIDHAGGVRQALERTRDYLTRTGRRLPIEIETRSIADIEEVFASGGADRIMLDNFDVKTTAEAVRLIDGRAEVESSGGITLDTIADYAAAGVDFICVGALTHKIKSLDMSLKLIKL